MIESRVFRFPGMTVKLISGEPNVRLHRWMKAGA